MFGLVADVAADGRKDTWVVVDLYVLDDYLFHGGLYRLGADRAWTYFASAAGVDMADAAAVTVDAEDNLWVETYDGLVVRRADGTWTRALGDGGPEVNRVWLVAVSPPGDEVWLGASAGEDVEFYRGHLGGPWQQLGPGEAHELVPHTMGVDRRGNLWWASEMAAGVRWADGRWERFPSDDILGDGYIDSITVDRTGAAWLAISSTELVRVDCP
jgi:ligand-binding sensor domain-containing protein